MERVARLAHCSNVAPRGVVLASPLARIPHLRHLGLHRTVCLAAEGSETAPTTDGQEAPAATPVAATTSGAKDKNRAARVRNDKPKARGAKRDDRIRTREDDKQDSRRPAGSRPSNRNASRERTPPPPLESLPGDARRVIQARTNLLLEGEAVGLSMSPTPEDLAMGFKGLRPLSQELKRKDHTLLFFPSMQIQQQPDQAKEGQQQEQPASTGASSSSEVPADRRGQERQQRRQQGGSRQEESRGEEKEVKRVIDLALVAVPRFEAPKPEVTIRVGAKSDPGTISRVLTRALLGSSTVAVHAAGPAAAMVALRAAVATRRALAAEEQLDLAFSIEYINLPLIEVNKPPTDQEPSILPDAAAAAATATTAPAAETVQSTDGTAPPAAASAGADGAVGSGNSSSSAGTPDSSTTNTSSGGAGTAGAPAKEQPAMASVLQFSFYKRALPTPEVLVSDFTPTRSLFAFSQLLTDLMGERRQVDLVLASSRDALFAVQALARVVRNCWAAHGASVGVFITSLEPLPDDPEHFSARMQLRRIPGAPNFVAARGGGTTSRESLMGAPLGTVRYKTQVEDLAAAMGHEFDSAGVYSLLPEEGVCVARVLQALWEVQKQRAAAAAASGGSEEGEGKAGGSGGNAAADGADGTAAAVAASSSSAAAVQIAIVPEIQLAERDSSSSSPSSYLNDEDDDDSRRGGQRRSRWGRHPGEEGAGDGGSEREGELRRQRWERRGGVGSERPDRERRGPGAQATVLHLVEVTPVLAGTLRLKAGATMEVADGTQLLQVMKAVVLRNRMYGNRLGGKLMVLRPSLGKTGALSVTFEYVANRLVFGIPQPPPARQAGIHVVQYSSVASSKGPVAGASSAAAAAAASRVLSSASRRRRSGAGEEEEDAAFGGGGGGGGYATDDEYGVGAEAAVLRPAAPAVAAATAAAAAAMGKAPWVLFVNGSTRTNSLAFDIIDETCKPYDRLSPAWLRVLSRPKPVALAALAVAQAQPQVQERADVQLQILPVLDRMRDEKDRPFNGLTFRLIKDGPGAEPGASRRLHDQQNELVAREMAASAKEAAEKRAVGPSPAAMAAAAAAAAKFVAKDNALLSGTRKMW